MSLNRELKINKKFIIILILVNILALTLYYSYALFEIRVIKDQVIVINSGSINLSVSVANETNNTFTVNQGETKIVTVNLTSTNNMDISYKLTYTTTSNDLIIMASEYTDNNVVYGDMFESKTIYLTFKNTGSTDATISIGGRGGLKGLGSSISLETGEIALTTNATGNEKVLNGANIKSSTVASCQNKVIWVDKMDTANDPSDDVTYISGSKDCIDFNYLWYSGKMWRIVAIYPDGSMKLVTDNNITSIAFNEPEQVNFYTDSNTTSYMYQFLNEDFYDTLYDPDGTIIKTDAEWNFTLDGNSTASRPSTLSNQQTTTAPVGLLNIYEYQRAYPDSRATSSTNYLNVGYSWWTLTPYSGSNLRDVNEYGTIGSGSPIFMFGARPSIIIKSGISLIGTGTKSNPYKIVGDIAIPTFGTTLVNERVFVKNSNTYSYNGEYIKIKYQDGGVDALSPLYRIVGIEENPNNTSENITKLVAMDYADNKATKVFATANSNGSGTIFGQGDTIDNTDKSTWYSYLNGTFENNASKEDGWFHSLGYNNLLTSGKYYLRGSSSTSTINYKASVCNSNTPTESVRECIANLHTVTTDNFNVGLLRYGEMFATQQGSGSSNSINMWLITRNSSSHIWYVTNVGRGNYYYPARTYGARPSIYLKSSVKFLECPNDSICDGTEEYPYIVGI